MDIFTKEDTEGTERNWGQRGHKTPEANTQINGGYDGGGKKKRKERELEVQVKLSDSRSQMNNKLCKTPT